MKLRILTALVGIPLVLGVCFCSHPVPIGLLLLAVYFVGADELRRFARLPYYPSGLFALVVSSPILMAMATPVSKSGDDLPFLAPMWVLGLFAAVWSLRDVAPLKKRVLVEFGAFWLMVPLLQLINLHKNNSLPSLWDWKQPLLMVLIPLWIGDSLAYFGGRAFGKHLLAPSISPKKTWEGAIANFFGCILGAWLVGTQLLAVPMASALVIGALAGVLGQAGDLFESWLKRKADIKDSGSLLPGHGGILDRIDSLLFTAIPTAIILAWASR